jgi:large subunit ribosomal protein L29
MKAKDLRERSVEDLRELEKSLQKDTFTHRFKNFTNRLDDTSLINKTKRDLARVKTILAQLAKGDAAPKAAKTTKKKASTKKSEAK